MAATRTLTDDSKKPIGAGFKTPPPNAGVYSTPAAYNNNTLLSAQNYSQYTYFSVPREASSPKDFQHLPQVQINHALLAQQAQQARAIRHRMAVQQTNAHAPRNVEFTETRRPAIQETARQLLGSFWSKACAKVVNLVETHVRPKAEAFIRYDAQKTEEARQWLENGNQRSSGAPRQAPLAGSTPAPRRIGPAAYDNSPPALTPLSLKNFRVPPPAIFAGAAADLNTLTTSQQPLAVKGVPKPVVLAPLAGAEGSRPPVRLGNETPIELAPLAGAEGSRPAVRLGNETPIELAPPADAEGSRSRRNIEDRRALDKFAKRYVDALVNAQNAPFPAQTPQPSYGNTAYPLWNQPSRSQKQEGRA